MSNHLLISNFFRIFAQEGGVGALIRLLKPTEPPKQEPKTVTSPQTTSDSSFIEQKGVILRALGTICCVEESISELQARGGLDILAQTLRESEEKVKYARFCN